MALSMPVLSNRHDLIKDIDSAIRDKKPKSPKDAQPLLQVIEKALADLHKKGIAHLDLGPQNSSVDAQGQNPIILDYGFSRTITQDRLDGLQTGDKSYNAPEAVSNQLGKVTVKADAYSLGQLMLALLDAQMHRRGRPVSEIRFKNLQDKSLQDLIRGLLQPKVEERMSVEQALRHPYLAS